jgi:hypothetical protein
MDIKDKGRDSVDCVVLIQSRTQWQAVLNTVTNLRVS